MISKMYRNENWVTPNLIISVLLITKDAPQQGPGRHLNKTDREGVRHKSLIKSTAEQLILLPKVGARSHNHVKTLQQIFYTT